MIRIYKCEAGPAELESAGYTAESVRAQILLDQRGKCYICEREMGTDFQIEHRRSQKNFPEKVNDWRNLLLACSYCNGKKSADFDDIVDPTSEDVEVLISQYYDTELEVFIFKSIGDPSPAVQATCKLLSRIFNGRDSTRLTVKEKQFRRAFLECYNRFSAKINAYLANPSSETTQSVIDELGIQETYLGFKYWIVMSAPVLRDKFGPLMNWNRV